VNLPAALTGIPDRSADPEVAAIQEELEDLSKRIPINDLQLPPEQERSPSPEPVYDKCVLPGALTPDHWLHILFTEYGLSSICCEAMA